MSPKFQHDRYSGKKIEYSKIKKGIVLQISDIFSYNTSSGEDHWSRKYPADQLPQPSLSKTKKWPVLILFKKNRKKIVIKAITKSKKTCPLEIIIL